MKRFLFIAAALALLVANGCTNSAVVEEPNRDVLHQVSTLQALVAGYYYPVTDAGTMLSHGDIGMGTFEGVDGEMIILDGVCYRALADGTIEAVENSATIPFGISTWFDADITKEFSGTYDMAALTEELDKIVKENGANTFYLLKLDGTFSEMRVRSLFRQTEPYPELAEVTKNSQAIFDYKDIPGTLVAVYFPSYANGINAVGWHLHFLSQDKSKGGHVLGFTLTEGTVALDRTDTFRMTLPDTDKFNELNLLGRDAAIVTVEKGK